MNNDNKTMIHAAIMPINHHSSFSSNISAISQDCCIMCLKSEPSLSEAESGPSFFDEDIKYLSDMCNGMVLAGSTAGVLCALYFFPRRKSLSITERLDK